MAEKATSRLNVRFGDWATPNQPRAECFSILIGCEFITVCALKELSMKMVVAILQPERLPCVQHALKRSKAQMVTVHRRRAHPDIRVQSSPQLRMEIFTEDKDAEEVVDAVRHAACPNGANFANEGRVFVVTSDRGRDLAEREHEPRRARAR
jgi:nitrogen regulatory protein PII